MYEAYALGDDSDWTWLVSTQPVSVEDTAEWVLGKVLDDELVPYAVIDLRTGQAVGLVSYMAIERMQGSVEIGHVTWSRKMKGSRLGTETVWLLLRNAFEHGYRRLEWKCDSMNTASRNAAERLGFVWEGRLRQKLVRKGATATATCCQSLMANGHSGMPNSAPGWLKRILTGKGGSVKSWRRFVCKICPSPVGRGAA